MCFGEFILALPHWGDSYLVECLGHRRVYLDLGSIFNLPKQGSSIPDKEFHVVNFYDLVLVQAESDILTKVGLQAVLEQDTAGGL